MPLTDSSSGTESEEDKNYKPPSKVKSSELYNRNTTRSFKSECGSSEGAQEVVGDITVGLKRSIAISDLSSVENLTELFDTRNSLKSSENSGSEIEVNMGENEDIKAM